MTLRQAIVRLDDSPLDVVAVSRFFATPCFPAGAGPDYVNAAAMLRGALEPADVLRVLHRIEAEFGRARGERWGQRTLDLDLIAIGDRVLPDEATYRAWRDLPPDRQIETTPDQLILPHPRLQDRAFVLIPLNDIAPDWVHPVSGRTVSQMLGALPASDKTDVIPL
jgi:2-amino-4-hydroxy-6-hydroxymethyldihydropteridine diphosphokinase